MLRCVAAIASSCAWLGTANTTGFDQLLAHLALLWCKHTRMGIPAVVAPAYAAHM